MSKGIPPETLQQIRDRIDLLDVISRYVTLSKTGQNYKGLCPFHSEKSPSFSVSPSRQMFHCFGCGVGGDAFTFLMKREGLGFYEAVQELARQAGIPLASTPKGGREDGSSYGRERYHYIHTVATDWFHANLTENVVGKHARAYLERRGISVETVKTFSLGYAPPGWSGLLTALRKSGVKNEELFQSGLVVKKERGDQQSSTAVSGYDRFRDRIMFPISNNRGQVVGFGGRVLRDDQQPKYLNSPETPWFSKGRTLFGFDKSREVASQLGQLVLVEGYFDVLALYESGVRHVAAPLGTALTHDHVQSIRRIVKSVLLFFDGDEAGVGAALRTLDLFLNTGLTVNVMGLPPGEDPDTFIRSHGLKAFTELATNAPTLLDFSIERTLNDRKSASIEDRVRSVDDILRIIQKTHHPIEREKRIQVVAERLGIRENTLLERYPMLRNKSNRSPHRKEVPRAGSASLNVLPKGSPEERDIAVLALQGALKAEHVQQLQAEVFAVPQYRRIVELAIQHVDSNGLIDVGALCAVALDDDDLGPVVSQLSLGDSHFDDALSHFQECLVALERKHIQHSLNECIAELRIAEQKRNTEDIQRVMVRINELRGKKASLTTSPL